MTMNRLQLQQLKAWHERQLDQINNVLPGCQSCRFAAPSCNCEIHHAKPPMDVWLRQGCDQWEHEIGRPIVMFVASDADIRENIKPRVRALTEAELNDMDGDIPF
jgi:hypothetical protein